MHCPWFKLNAQLVIEFNLKFMYRVLHQYEHHLGAINVELLRGGLKKE